MREEEGGGGGGGIESNLPHRQMGYRELATVLYYTVQCSACTESLSHCSSRP